MRLIEVVPYQPEWPQMFAAESTQITNALGKNCIAIHHIGSTSVPSLASKPIIDIMPVVTDITVVDQQNSNMQQLGYTANGENGILFRRFFQKGTTPRTHHVHVFEVGSPEIERHLKFRDWIRTHEHDRNAYATLKQQLAQQFPHDIMSYCLGKETFIDNINSLAGWNGIRIVVVLTPKEWQAFYRIKEQQLKGVFISDDGKHAANPAENHFNFVLYQGSQISCAAEVEFINQHEAIIRSLASDIDCQNQCLEATMRQLLEKWISQQGRITI